MDRVRVCGSLLGIGPRRSQDLLDQTGHILQPSPPRLTNLDAALHTFAATEGITIPPKTKAAG